MARRVVFFAVLAACASPSLVPVDPVLRAERTGVAVPTVLQSIPLGERAPMELVAFVVLGIGTTSHDDRREATVCADQRLTARHDSLLS